MPIVSARQLSKHYGDDAHPVKALDRVDFAVHDGERVALVGRSGSGKTTLLNLLAGLDTPTGGVLEVGGLSLGTLGSKGLANYRCRQIGVVFQSFQLLPNCSALANVEIPLMIQGVPGGRRRGLAEQAIERVGLKRRQHHRPSQLSGGEQQRIAIARAIVHRPPLLLADEPTGNLDSATADSVTKLILEVVEETAAAMVLITHDATLAKDVSTRMVRLSDGRVAEDDS